MAQQKNPYADTLNLPQTDFPMRAGLSQQEPAWVQRWLAEDVYGKLRAKRLAANAEKFILHLGPPYANGHMHMGHALTYILKDFIVRSQFMLGKDSPYVPGWDCHGLPIEWKIEQALQAEGKSKYDISIKDLRDKCRAYAEEWIAVQKSEWQRFGCLGDWQRPYKTMNSHNEAGIVRELGKLVARGLVYKGLRSTLWSTVEETALAEAEVEYKENHTSKAIHVKFSIQEKAQEYIVIWTTTPWTMPANRAVAFAAEESYVALRVEAVADGSLARVGEIYWVAAKLQAACIRAWQITEFATVGQCQGTDFAGLTTIHPFYDRPAPLLAGGHVTVDAGTGFVHIAPAHGQEDFALGQHENLDLHCPVQGNGAYDDTVAVLPTTGVTLQGRNIWEAQDAIIAEMRSNGSLLQTYAYQHSYPVSWRSKAPLIFRATNQWFINLDKPIPELGQQSIRQQALAAIHGGGALRQVQWVPETGENRIGSMIANRPDWCISRQRAWGVPIMLFRHKQTDAIIQDPAVFEHIAQLVEQEGIDAWNTRLTPERLPELFPAGWLNAHNITLTEWEPQTDIMDVWIDSGTTHAHVLRAESAPGERFHRADGKRPADLYQEGSDQHRGWFHSSLLTSIANYNDAPYEAVVTNGFVVDGQGRKFSKSLGNGVEPRQLWDQFGMDIVRLWVANSDYAEDIRYSDEIIQTSADAYRRYRNTFRFLLGNLNDFNPTTDAVAYENLPEIERYVLHELQGVLSYLQAEAQKFKFHRSMREIYGFCETTLSNLYFDVRKDSLYCDGMADHRRRSCQTVLHWVFHGLLTHLAPILSFTTDEAWRARQRALGQPETSVHLETYLEIPAVWKQGEAVCATWAQALALRDEINQHIESHLRQTGQVGANTDVAVTLPPTAGLCPGTWQDLLVVSQVQVGESLSVRKATGDKCPRCWTYHAALPAGVCARCQNALQTQRAA